MIWSRDSPPPMLAVSEEIGETVEVGVKGKGVVTKYVTPCF